MNQTFLTTSQCDGNGMEWNGMGKNLAVADMSWAYVGSNCETTIKINQQVTLKQKEHHPKKLETLQQLTKTYGIIPGSLVH